MPQRSPAKRPTFVRSAQGKRRGSKPQTMNKNNLKNLLNSSAPPTTTQLSNVRNRRRQGSARHEFFRHEFFRTRGKCLASPFRWAQHGESGSWVSDLLPHLSKHVDKMCFLHSMYLKQNSHAPVSLELMCGTNRPGLPALGAWMTYWFYHLNGRSRRQRWFPLPRDGSIRSQGGREQSSCE